MEAEQLTAAHPELHSWNWETTPLMVGRVLYLSTSLSQAVALAATHGRRKRKGLVPAASLW